MNEQQMRAIGRAGLECFAQVCISFQVEDIPEGFAFKGFINALYELGAPSPEDLLRSTTPIDPALQASRMSMSFNRSEAPRFLRSGFDELGARLFAITYGFRKVPEASVMQERLRNLGDLAGQLTSESKMQFPGSTPFIEADGLIIFNFMLERFVQRLDEVTVSALGYEQLPQSIHTLRQQLDMNAATTVHSYEKRHLRAFEGMSALVWTRDTLMLYKLLGEYCRSLITALEVQE